jgi:hypothetical protein
MKYVLFAERDGNERVKTKKRKVSEREKKR